MQFTISPELAQKCVELVRNEFDYIWPADGISEDYSIVNLKEDGVWIVDNETDKKAMQVRLTFTLEQLPESLQDKAIKSVQR